MQLGRRRLEALRAAAGGDRHASSTDADACSGDDAGSSGNGSGGDGSGGASGSGVQPGNGAGGRRREPCIPPLPHWAEAVSVVGLPGDQLVFRFHTPTEAAAVGRRQLRPEEPYGAAALKLATLPGERVQGILDRWQYAVAQRELASLDARPRLWWQYESALKGSSGGGGSGGMEGPPPRAQPALSRRQQRRAAKAAKAAARAAARGKPVSSRSSSSGRAGLRERDGSGSSSSSSSSSSGETQQAPSGLVIDAAAFEQRWQVCTLRGLPDGTTIYKFSDEFEPLAVGSELAVGPEAATAAASIPVAPFAREAPPGGYEGQWWRQQQRPAIGQLLMAQQQQGSLEGVAWSSALRLGVKFESQVRGGGRGCTFLPM